MDRREQAERNLECARAFLTRLLDTPAEQWPEDGSAIIFAPTDEPDLADANRRTLAGALPEGTPVHVVTDVSSVSPGTRRAPEEPDSGSSTPGGSASGTGRASAGGGTATGTAGSMSSSPYDALLGGALKGIDARSLGITGPASMPGLGALGAAEMAGLGALSTTEQLEAFGMASRSAGGLQQAVAVWHRQLGPMAESAQRMLASMQEAYVKPMADLAAAMAPFSQGLQASLLAMQETVARYDLPGLELQTAVVAAIRDLGPEPFRAPMAASLRAFFDRHAESLLGMSGDEFLSRYEAGELPATDDPDESKKVGVLVTLMPLVKRAA